MSKTKIQPWFLPWKTFFKGEVKWGLIASFQPVEDEDDNDGNDDDDDDDDDEGGTSAGQY